MKITLYKGLTCPKCKIVAMKLDAVGIKYEIVTDPDYMLSIGVTTIPTLEVDGKRYVDVKECRDWIHSIEGQL